jgi:hypothetical protein
MQSDWSKVRVDQTAGGRATVTATAVAAGSVLFSFSGAVQAKKAQYSLQVGTDMHIVARDATPEPPWIFMNHSYAPTVQLEPLALTAAADEPIRSLAARALAPLPAGAPVTFDYSLWEWELEHPFQCAQTGRWVRGWLHLSEEEKDAALPHAAAHIRALHDRWLFGQSSRC